MGIFCIADFSAISSGHPGLIEVIKETKSLTAQSLLEEIQLKVNEFTGNAPSMMILRLLWYRQFEIGGRNGEGGISEHGNAVDCDHRKTSL